MEYSTQDLARLAGVSVRTIRHYDEIGLLVPKIRMKNGRCYYGIKEVISLSQIRSLKELGLSLSKIKSLIDEKVIYKKINILVMQKKILRKEQDRLKSSLQMVDSIIKYYKENNMDITPEAIEAHFEQMNKKEYVKYFDESYMQEKAKEFKDNFKLRVGDKYYDVFLKKSEQQNIFTAQEYGKRFGLCLGKLSESFEKGLDESSSEVQNIIGEQWEVLKIVYPDTNSYNVYTAIRDQLCSFSKGDVDERNKSFSDYMFKAMTIYAENNFRKE